MDKTITTISEEINNYVRTIEERHQKDYSMITELSIQYIAQQLENVKSRFELDVDLSHEDEIFYFKNIKCHLLALTQYYLLVQKIELRKPPCTRKKLKQYYLRSNYKIKKKLRKRRCWYNYYKSSATSMDHLLFKRADQHHFLLADSYIIDVDKYSSTAFVHIFAQIEAYEMLRHYLKKKIKNLDLSKKQALSPSASTVKWTAAKADLIELIYSLHAAGVFNHGRAEIKEIADCFQTEFDIDLGQYNRVFLDIRSRKTNKTKFMDGLKRSLIKRMERTENQLFP